MWISSSKVVSFLVGATIVIFVAAFLVLIMAAVVAWKNKPKIKKDDIYAQKQGLAKWQRICAGVVVVLYLLVVAFAEPETVHNRGSIFLLQVIAMVVYFFVYWMGRVFEPKWLQGQLFAIMIIIVATFLPFL